MLVDGFTDRSPATGRVQPPDRRDAPFVTNRANAVKLAATEAAPAAVRDAVEPQGPDESLVVETADEEVGDGWRAWS